MDHYQTLAVEKTATADEIKRAYRRLASQHHPDKGGSTEQFQRIEEAYRILGDPTSRSQYDRAQSPSMTGGFNPFGGFGNFEDLIRQFHSGPGRQQRVYTIGVPITLEQSAMGSTENVHLNTVGGGKLVQIKIPQGIENGQQIRYDGIMEDGYLQVAFIIKPHVNFKREGLDLYSIREINIFDLILGTKIKFTTLLGKELEITVPPRFRPGGHLRLAGHGMTVNGQTGSQYILINALIPEIISTELIEMIRQEPKN
jgi:DnaJ-class molecular chaperone